jgi:N-acetylglutamate synthase-like GNAT family acetyltransferase
VVTLTERPFLRPMVEDDLEGLYRLAGQQYECWPRLSFMGKVMLTWFADVIRNDVLMQYVIEVDDVMVGAAALYQYSTENRVAWADVVVFDGTPDAVVSDATVLMTEQAFGNWQLRSLYTMRLDFQLSLLAALGCEVAVEGRLAESYRARGRYCDQVIEVVHADAWSSRNAPADLAS